MPCQGGPSYDAIERAKSRDLKRDFDRLAEVACAACQALEDSDISIPAIVADWWEEHKEADRIRELEEVKRRELTLKRLRAQRKGIEKEIRKLEKKR